MYVCCVLYVPLFHMLFDQQVVVSCPNLVGAITKVGAHMNPVLVLVVMDTTTQVHFHYVCLFTDVNLHTQTHTQNTKMYKLMYHNKLKDIVNYYEQYSCILQATVIIFLHCVGFQRPLVVKLHPYLVNQQC